jgi:hypothetical protein
MAKINLTILPGSTMRYSWQEDVAARIRHAPDSAACAARGADDRRTEFTITSNTPHPESPHEHGSFSFSPHF